MHHRCTSAASGAISSKVKKENMVHGGAALTKRARGFMRPMKLKSSVRTSRKASRIVPCLSEMTAVMSCWKVNSFDDVPCRSEIQDFVACAEKARSDPSAAVPSAGGYKWTTEEVNERLRRFVWAQ